MARETTRQPADQARKQQGEQQGSGTRRTGLTGDAATGRQDRERSIHPSREHAWPRSTAPGLTPQGRYGTDQSGGLESHFARMQRMADDMDRLLDQFGMSRPATGLSPFGASFRSPTGDGRSAGRLGGGLFDQVEPALWSPEVEMFERGGKLVVRADLPGMKKDDVTVDIEDGALTIRGERREEREENEEGFYRSERTYGEFFRAVPIPDGIDADACEAKYADGVLEVVMSMPKGEHRKGKRLKIR